MPKIYLSFSAVDQHLASALEARLTELGYEVSGISAIPAGAPWVQTLTKLLREADAVVGILTENAVNSPNVMSEMGVATAYMDEADKLGFIPVVFNREAVPGWLAHRIYLIADRDNLQDVAERIDAAMKKRIGVATAREEKRAEAREQIRKDASTYIEATLGALKEREQSYGTTGFLWLSIGFAALIAGVITAFAFTSGSPRLILESPNAWAWLAYFGVRGLLIIGLLVAVSKYAFNLGRSFMNERLRTADRMHAISFGKFYLDAFGEKAAWEELKEVFQHWNIDTASSFCSLQASDHDPKFHDSLIGSLKQFAGKDDKR